MTQKDVPKAKCLCPFEGKVAQPIETSVTATNSRLSQDYTNLDDHISQTSIDTPIATFKPLTLTDNIKLYQYCSLL